MRGGRIVVFDSLRGIFALCVVLSHFTASNYEPYFFPRPASPIEFFLFYLGAPAVDCFFVLSGLVVAGSYERYQGVIPFYVARFRRLYPIALIGGLMGLLMARPLAAQLPQDAIDHGYYLYLLRPLRLVDVSGVLSMGLLGNFDAYRISTPLWTLAVEVYASLLIPLMVYAARRLKWWSLPLSYVVCVLLSTVFEPLLFMPIFLLGVLLYFYPPRLPTQRAALWGLASVGAALLFSRHLHGHFGPLDDLYRYVTSAGAALFLLAMRQLDPASLHQRFLQWLGSRSYALYATHYPVLLLGVVLFRGHLPPMLSAALMLPAALVVADVVQRLADRLSQPKPI